MLKNYPPYRTIKYYYSDQTVSDTFDSYKDYTKVNIIATLMLCINGSTYISVNGGTPIIPDRYLDDIIYPSNWLNIKSVEYCINYQPYDIDKWNKNNMYSKEFWNMVLGDMRDVKINYISENLKDIKWTYID